jgi:multiple sugar transport system substrate-binding protein
MHWIIKINIVGRMQKQIKLSETASLVEQIANIIIGDLKKSKPGDRILPERALAEKYNVSRRTASAAIRHLTNQGLLERKVGRGTYVPEKFNADAISPCVLVSFSQSSSAYSSMEKILQQVNSKSKVITAKYFHGTYSLIGDFLELIKIRSLEKKPMDLIYVNEGLIPVMAERGLICPVNELLESSKNLDRNAFNPNLLEAYTYKGELYGIPQVYYTNALFYNKDYFDRLNLPYPTPEWSWEDMSKIAGKLTSDTTADIPKVFGLGFTPSSVNNFMPFFYQNCPEGKENEIFSLPEAEESASFLYNMAYKHKTCLFYSGGIFGPVVPFYELFQKGHLGMFQGQYSDYIELQKKCDFNWGICELPQKKRKACSIPTQGWAVSSTSASKQKSFTAIEKLMSQKITDIYCQDFSRLPAYKMNKELYPEVFINALDYAIPARTAFPLYIENHNIFTDELALLFNGHATPEDFCRNIKECLKKT